VAFPKNIYKPAFHPIGANGPAAFEKEVLRMFRENGRIEGQFLGQIVSFGQRINV
jgi:hypothetical protein